MQDETLSSLKEFSKIRLRTTRQIASHDYASIDFKLVFNICNRITKDSVNDELSEFIEEDEDGNDKQDR